MSHKGVLLILAGFSVALPARAQQGALGRPNRLANGLSVVATLVDGRDSTVWVDNNRTQKVLGLVLTVAITNNGKSSIAQDFTSYIDGTGTVEIHYEPVDSGPVQVSSGEHELVGGGAGYQTKMYGGGLKVADSAGCADRNPVGVFDGGGHHIGISTHICTAPGQTDRIRFALPRPDRRSRSVVVVKCAGCPEGGLRLQAGEHNSFGTPRPGRT